MALWLLGMTQDTRNQFSDSFYFCRGFVVHADSETDARAMANRAAVNSEFPQITKNLWLSADKTTCVEIDDSGPCEIILTAWQGE